MIFISLFYIIAVTAGKYLSFFEFIIPFFIISLLVFFIYKKFKWDGTILILFFSVIGFLLSHNTFQNESVTIKKLIENKKNLLITGTVKEISHTQSGNIKIIFKVSEIKADNETYECKVNIISYLNKDANVDNIEVEEKLILEGKLENFESARNFGGYDEKLVMLSKNIKYKSFAKIHSSFGVNKGFSLHINNIKNKFLNVYDNVLPERESGIMKGMIVGDESFIDDEITELYQTSGIYHVISISGTHITILMVFVLYILNRFFGMKKAQFLTMLFLIFYCVLSGGSPSALRATIMGVTLITGQFFYRDYDFLSSICVSSLILLIYNPAMLFNIGFQLSYGAILGILIFTEPLQTGVDSFFTHVLHKKTVKMPVLCASLGANIIITPITLYYFYYFYPYSILANILVDIFASFLIVGGFIVGIIGFFSLPIAQFFAGSLFFILKIYEEICKEIYNLPFSKILIGRPSAVLIIIYIGIMLLLYMFLTSKHNEKQKYFGYIIFSISIFIFASFITQIIKSQCKMVMLDVGQGDCFVFNYKNKYYVIDGGENTFVLKNYLNYSGINEIEGVFLSHTDSDHSLGIISILDNKKIKNIYLPKADFKDDDIFNQIEKLSAENEVSMHFIKNDDIINPSENISMKCFAPSEDLFLNKNKDSMVLKLNLNGVTFLFTGDIEEESEQKILKLNAENGENLNADILKVAHHGSKTSTTENFFEAVSPKIAIIGVGKNNRYGHPTDEVIERIANNNTEILRTDLHGDVILHIKGTNVKITKKLSAD